MLGHQDSLEVPGELMFSHVGGDEVERTEDDLVDQIKVPP